MHMDCREMVGRRAKAGRGALSVWLWICRVSVGEVRLENVKEMSSAEVKCMLNDCAWREVNKLWAEELTDWPKLCVLKELVGRGFKQGVWG